jgi:hypothetical protein
MAALEAANLAKAEAARKQREAAEAAAAQQQAAADAATAAQARQQMEAEQAAAALAQQQAAALAAAAPPPVAAPPPAAPAAPRDPTPAEIAAAKVPYSSEKYIVVGSALNPPKPGHRYLLVHKDKRTEYSDDPTVPLHYAHMVIQAANQYDLHQPGDDPTSTSLYTYSAMPDTWQKKRMGGRRVLTFRRKPKSRSKNGRRPTRKSAVRRNR